MTGLLSITYPDKSRPWTPLTPRPEFPFVSSPSTFPTSSALHTGTITQNVAPDAHDSLRDSPLLLSDAPQRRTPPLSRGVRCP